MSNDNEKNEKPPLSDELEEALNEFENSGGFSGNPKPQSSTSLKSDSQEEQNKNSSSAQTPKDAEQKKSSTESSDDFDDIFEDFDDIDEKSDIYEDDDAHEDDEYEITEEGDEDEDENLDREDVPKDNKGNNAKDRFTILTQKLKEPKNAVIFVIAICFLLFLLLKSGDKKNKIKYQAVDNVQEEVLSDISDIKKEKIITPNSSGNQDAINNIPLQDISLPNLDIKLPDIKESNISLIPKIPEPKTPDTPPPNSTQEIPTDINIQIPEPEEIIIKGGDKSDVQQKNLSKEDNLNEEGLITPPVKNRAPITDKTQLKPLVTDFTGGANIPSMTAKRKAGNDFIFIDTDLDTEVEQNAISATRLQNPENIVAQGRMIDAVLETAINSSIGGQIRAIVSKDVYAEVGRNILIPKGTRLYGEYGSDGSNASEKGRIIITWTRIMRPDNVSAKIQSFASDQFGRSGIQGEVDKKGFASVTSSMLLSTIPLVTTIVTNALTNMNPQTTTVGAATGTTTVVQDPINIATQSFTKQVSQITSDIIQGIDTTTIITLNQGTRIKVLVNQDIKLPTYRPVTKSSSGVGG